MVAVADPRFGPEALHRVRYVTFENIDISASAATSHPKALASHVQNIHEILLQVTTAESGAVLGVVNIGIVGNLTKYGTITCPASQGVGVVWGGTITLPEIAIGDALVVSHVQDGSCTAVVTCFVGIGVSSQAA